MTRDQAPHWTDQAQLVADRLHALLQQEFEALKGRDLDAFEALQGDKNHCLQQLDAWAQQAHTEASPHPQWTRVQERVAQCLGDHRRNENLLNRQLLATRGALQALQSAQGVSSVELYDRLGQVSQRGGARGYSDA